MNPACGWSSARQLRSAVGYPRKRSETAQRPCPGTSTSAATAAQARWMQGARRGPCTILRVLQAACPRTARVCTGAFLLQHSLPNPACRPGTPGQRPGPADLRGGPSPAPGRPGPPPHLRPPAPPPPRSPRGSTWSPSASAGPPACSRSPRHRSAPVAPRGDQAPGALPSGRGPTQRQLRRGSGDLSGGASPVAAAPAGRWPPRAPDGTGPPAPGACKSRG